MFIRSVPHHALPTINLFELWENGSQQARAVSGRNFLFPMCFATMCSWNFCPRALSLRDAVGIISQQIHGQRLKRSLARRILSSLLNGRRTGESQNRAIAGISTETNHLQLPSRHLPKKVEEGRTVRVREPKVGVHGLQNLPVANRCSLLNCTVCSQPTEDQGIYLDQTLILIVSACKYYEIC